MAQPWKVSRSGREDIPGVEFCAWNGFVHVCFRDLAELNPIQRVPGLVLQYHGEVMNGGHFQYFANKADWNHDEVRKALRSIGAVKADRLFEEAMRLFEASEAAPINTVAEYVAADEASGMVAIDLRWYEEAEAQLDEGLKRYLEEHEAEFVEWVE